ncbi:MAG: YggT family protein [Gemmatimonadaceae bacterium]
MESFYAAYYALLGVLRVALFAIAALLAAVCAVDWAVRTRRISPFGPVARFFRANVDPLIAPVERRVVRAGGLPTSAPWWALAAVVVGGILLISLLTFLGEQIVFVYGSVAAGPRGIYRLLVSATFSLLQIALLVRVASSWFRISPYSGWVRWSYALTEPILRPLRKVVPTIGMIDITPIIAYFVLQIAAGFLLGLRW